MANKKGTPKSKLSFLAGPVNDEKAEAINTSSMVAQMRANMEAGEKMDKSVKPQAVRADVKEKYDKSKIVFSTREWSQTSENVWLKGWRRVADAEQRELAQLDPYISAIISTRCSQGSVCGYPSESKFDKGCRIADLKPPKREDFDTDKDFEAACDRRAAQSESIMAWVLRCGTDDQDVVNAVFAGGDLTFKRCTLREFIEAQVRNILTFGRCGSQVFRNTDGLPVMFRPVAIETFYNVVSGEETFIGTGRDTTEQSLEDIKDYAEIKPEERPAAWQQRIDGKGVNFFTEDDLHVWHWQKQALFNLNGYPLSPIEQSIFMVFVHQQTLSYLRNQFVKGLATKGLLALESTNPAVDLSEADLEDFRIQFHNFATRNDNSAVMPVLSGPVKANFIQLSPTPRDMEFLQIEEHVIRALCSAFQISPQEMGYGHLSLPQGGLSQSNKQEEIVRGEERGLRQLLDIVFDGINEILYQNFPEARDNFRVSYVGVGEDTRDSVVQRQQAEMNTTATLESLYSDSEKKDLISYGGKVPLNPQFHNLVVRFMKYGEVLEHLFGVEGASKRPEYDFIVDPNLNQAYTMLKVQPVQKQKEAADMQLQMQEQQMQAAQMQQQQAAAGGQPGPEGAPPDGQPQEQPQQGAAPEGQPAAEPTEKSEEPVPLRQKYLESKGLQKSMKGYFGAWLHAHHENND